MLQFRGQFPLPPRAAPNAGGWARHSWGWVRHLSPDSPVSYTDFRYLPAKMAFWAWHASCQAWFMFSKNVEVWIFRHLVGSLDLYLPLAVEAEPVDPYAILLGIDECLDLPAELVQRVGFQPAFEDRVLHPRSEILERVRQAVDGAVNEVMEATYTYMSQSLNTAQGNSDADLRRSAPGPLLLSQSLNTDQGNSDATIGRHDLHVRFWSQFLNTDQGNSDGITFGRLWIIYVKVSIPQYRSGQFGRLPYQGSSRSRRAIRRIRVISRIGSCGARAFSSPGASHLLGEFSFQRELLPTKCTSKPSSFNRRRSRRSWR